MTRPALLALLLTASAAAAQPPQMPRTSPPVLDGADFSRDGRVVLIRFLTVGLGNSYHASVYDVATGKRLAGPAVTSPKRDWTAEALHPDGATLLVSRPAGEKADTRELVLWDWRAGREVRALDPPVALLDRATFTPDGKLLVTTHCDNRVLTWDVAAGSMVGALDRHDRPLPPSLHGPALVLGGSGRAVTADSDGLSAWDLASGRKGGPGVPSGLVRGDLAACSSDARYAVGVYMGIGPDETGVWMWDLEAGRQHRALSFPEGYVAAAAVTDGGRVLAASGRGVVRAWGADGKPLWRTSVGRWKGISRAAFSPDGRFLLTCGDRTTLQLWDTQKRKVVWSANEEAPAPRP